MGLDRAQNRNIPRARLKHISSTVKTYPEHGREIPRARSSTTKHTSCTVEHGRNILHARRALLKLTSSKVETYLERSRNIPRARSKHTSSTFEIYLKDGRNIPRACLKSIQARLNTSKHTPPTVKTNLEYDRNIPRARSKHTSSTKGKFLEHR